MNETYTHSSGLAQTKNNTFDKLWLANEKLCGTVFCMKNPRAKVATARLYVALCGLCAALLALRRTRAAADGERLVRALAGLGFSAARARAYVAGLGARVGREPIESLIREGIAELAA